MKEASKSVPEMLTASWEATTSVLRWDCKSLCYMYRYGGYKERNEVTNVNDKGTTQLRAVDGHKLA